MRFDPKAMMFVLLLPATASQAEEYRAAVDAKNEEFVAAYDAGDAAKLASLFTDDALILPPDASEIRGQEAIQALWQSWFDAGITNVAIQTRSVEGAGNLAYEVGDFTAAVPDGSGGTIQVTGNFVVVWKKDASGEWKYHIDTWNDAPIE